MAAFLQPQSGREINILILGETGVGKSTWINGFVNFLNFATLDEAEESESVNLIPTSFTMTDKNYEEITVTSGSCTNESTVVGQSATQAPKTYRFEYGTHILRLIDTPGIGDTRGIAFDKSNFQNIVAHLRHLPDIHGICILLKPNSARLTVMFQYCVKELLTHLHKDAAQNIVFCFTNARGTLYRPGETLPALRKLIQEYKDVSIVLNKETIYCVDNEAIRFLAALKQGVAVVEEDTRTIYSNSWEKSVVEFTRLIKHIEGLQPHKTKSTLTLNEARQLISDMTEPLAQIARNIDDNIAVLKEKEEELEKSKVDEKELHKKLYIPYVELDLKLLPYPRTVCTSESCIKVYKIDEEETVDYRECHARCYLRGVGVQQHPCPALLNCKAFKGGTNCKLCSCSWEKHMHVTFEHTKVSKRKTDSSIQELIDGKCDAATVVREHVSKLKKEIAAQTEEKEKVMRAGSKFACFLTYSAITPYNDSIEEYLLHLMEQEKSKIALGGNRDGLETYKKMLQAHKHEMEMLKMSATQGSATAFDSISTDDISTTANELQSLPLNGSTFKMYSSAILATSGSKGKYHEVSCKIPQKSQSSQLTEIFKNLYSGKHT